MRGRWIKLRAALDLKMGRPCIRADTSLRKALLFNDASRTVSASDRTSATCLRSVRTAHHPQARMVAGADDPNPPSKSN